MSPTTRAPRGAGRPYQRASDGKWVSYVSVNGKRVTRTRATKKEAYAAWRDLQRAQDAGKALRQPDRWTVGEWLTYWLEQQKPATPPNSYAAYSARVRHQIVPILGDRRLSDLKPFDVHEWLIGLRSRGLAASTISSARIILKTALDLAEDAELIPRNPVARVKLPKMARPAEIVPPDAAAVARFFAVADASPDAAYYRLALLGLRHGEILGLHWRDVDHGAAEIRVAWQVQRNRETRELDVRAVKSAAGDRTLPLTAPLAAALRARRQAQRAEQLAADRWADTGLVFTRPDGRALQQTTMRHRFKRLLVEAGLPPSTRLHDFRHALSSALDQLKVSAKVRQEILGHASPRITEGTYTHTATDRRQHREAIEALDRLLSNSQGVRQGVRKGRKVRRIAR